MAMTNKAKCITSYPRRVVHFDFLPTHKQKLCHVARLSSLATAINFLASASGVPRFLAFVPKHSLLKRSSAARLRHRHAVAFIDNTKEIILQKDETTVSMTDLQDAEAYHDMVSSAVDFTNVSARNGIITGKILL